MAEHRSHYIARTIIPAGQRSHAFGGQLLKGIDKNAFARLAPGDAGRLVKSNHPAWVFGHLAVYPARVLELIGHPDAAAAKNPRFEDLFKNGTDCHDDAAGTVYPTMEEITGAWDKGYQKVLDAIAEVPDEVFARENPAEGNFKQSFPTVGSAVGFLIAGHPMMHFGQVSAWRRFMGLPSAS